MAENPSNVTESHDLHPPSLENKEPSLRTSKTSLSIDEAQTQDPADIEKSDGKTVEANVTEETNEKAVLEQKDYSIFGKWQKKFIVLAATAGAFFSPFTGQIYFPALTTIAKDLNVTNSQINLTVTTYMVGTLSFLLSLHHW